MRIVRFDTESRAVHVELTRRNLEALLMKLNFMGEPPSARTISKTSGLGSVTVTVVEDSEHYVDREPGVMLNNTTGGLY